MVAVTHLFVKIEMIKPPFWNKWCAPSMLPLKTNDLRYPDCSMKTPTNQKWARKRHRRQQNGANPPERVL